MTANILTLIDQQGRQARRRKQTFPEELQNFDSENFIKIEPEAIYEEISENTFDGFNHTNIIPSTTDVGAMNLWTTKATACLITQYKKYKDHVGQTTKIKSLREMFEMISFEMQKYGFFFSAQKCENKWRVLERKYRNLVFRERLKKPGRMRHYGHWEHRIALDQIFAEQKQLTYLKESDFPPPSGSAKIAALALTESAKNGNIVNGSPDQSANNNIASSSESCTAFNVGSEASSEQSEIVKSFLANFVDEMTKNFALAERNSERRHQEELAMRRSELEVQKKLLKLKEKKLELQKIQMMAAAQNLGFNI